VGLTWEDHDRVAVNPTTGETLVATRRRIQRQLELPIEGEYSDFVREVIAHSMSIPPVTT
jgi:hypothetical protein